MDHPRDYDTSGVKRKEKREKKKEKRRDKKRNPSTKLGSLASRIVALYNALDQDATFLACQEMGIAVGWHCWLVLGKIKALI